MKFCRWLFGCGFIALSLTSFMGEKSLATLPLQAGVYKIGSRYIHLAQQENRMCVRVFSGNRAFIASVAVDPNGEKFYRLDGMKDIILAQKDKETLVFGPITHLSDYAAALDIPTNLDAHLQECLNSNEPFSKLIADDRPSR